MQTKQDKAQGLIEAVLSSGWVNITLALVDAEPDADNRIDRLAQAIVVSRSGPDRRDCGNCGNLKWPACNPDDTRQSVCGVKGCASLSDWIPIVEDEPTVTPEAARKRLAADAQANAKEIRDRIENDEITEADTPQQQIDALTKRVEEIEEQHLNDRIDKLECVT
jgi:hypothetical protein